MKNKNIILGITGSISAYKSPFLVRELIKEGASVNCVITPSGKKFVSKLVLDNLSRNITIDDMFDDKFQDSGSWHIDKAQKCDLFIIAPCSANTLAKIANGFCDNALTSLTTAIPKGIPKLIAPAMDSDMWENKAIQRNVVQLKEDGYIVLDPEYGELASGIIGQGRLPEVLNLIESIKEYI
jgi:phosphopantothenoylcysteine decarboxylase / phosphopantothenate---cysteine ligase